MNEILDITCDEAGHTGPDLLDKDQRLFSFGSVSIPDAEAFEIIEKARSLHPVQMPELKASRLIRSATGKKLISHVIKECNGRFAVNIHDKLLALCGWLFEYVYEPVYQHDNRLLYEKKLHQFVAMFTYLWMRGPDTQSRAAIEQFQKYMRSLNPSDAPFLFQHSKPLPSPNGEEHPFESVLHFATGYRDIIVGDNSRTAAVVGESGQWIDLSASALWSHLNHWGRTGKLLSIRCDASKPLRAIVGKFKGDDSDAGIRMARERGHKGPLGWKQIEPITFVDSRDSPAAQLADIVAGTTVSLFSADTVPDELKETAEIIQGSLLDDSIMPDFDVVNPRNRSAAVNALILYDMAQRAKRRGDPYEGLEEMYHFAEVSWAKGETPYKQGQT